MTNLLNRQFKYWQILLCIFLFAEFTFHRYTHHSWLFLIEFMIGLSFLLFSKESIFLPSKKILYFLLFSFLITALQAILNGSHLLEERWILRYMNLLVFFFGFQFFSEEENLISIRWPFITFILLVSGLSLLQYIFILDIASIDSIGVFASRFWNISFYAQAMSLSLPFISYFKSKTDSKNFSNVASISTLFILITVLASQSRASLAGIALFLLLEFWNPRGFNRKNLFYILLSATLIYFSIQTFKSDINSDIARMKKSSMTYRLNVLKKSIQMASDYPTGVGSSNFTYQLFLYFDKNPVSWQPFELYKTPHNEPLQVLVEDGWGVFAIYAFTLLIALFFTIKNIFNREDYSLFSRFFICLIPEIFLQFPFDMYFPVFLFAISFPLFLGEKNRVELHWSKLKSSLLVLCSLLLLFTYWIRERKILPKEYALTYCSIFHDNFDICKPYFQEFYLENNLSSANEIIRPLLKYQPYNFSALSLDYSLGVEPKSQIAACLYYDLFNGQKKIADSSTDICVLSVDRKQKRERFEEYSTRR